MRRRRTVALRIRARKLTQVKPRATQNQKLRRSPRPRQKRTTTPARTLQVKPRATQNQKLRRSPRPRRQRRTTTPARTLTQTVPPQVKTRANQTEEMRRRRTGSPERFAALARELQLLHWLRRRWRRRQACEPHELPPYCALQVIVFWG